MAFALHRPYRRAPAGRTVVTDPAAARPGRTRVAAARGAAAVGALLLAVSRLVRLVTTIVVLLIVAAIVLRVVGANPGNSIVRDIHDAGRWLVGPFKNVFSVKNAKESIALNWGLAALIYLIVGHALASVIARLAPRPSVL